MTAPARSPWPLVLLLYGAGLLAAAQLGKLSALAPLLAPALGMKLTTAAWAISLLEVGGATLGAVAGLLAHRLGLRRTLRLGAAALAAAGLGEGLAQGAADLIAWRLLEALGYLGVIVTAPVLIAQHAGRGGPRTLGLAMSLWSTFVPLGLALGAGAAAGAAGLLGWRGALVAGGALAALLALALWRLPLPAQQADGAAPGDAPAPPVRLGAAVWCLALAFGAFALFEVGMLGLLPTLLVQAAGLAPAAAGFWTGVASASAVGGSLWAAVLLRHGGVPRWPLMLALGLPALLLFGVFTPAPVPWLAVVLSIVLHALGGVFAALAFALLPRVAGSAAGMVRANGLLAQCGASGSLLGPPAMAACVAAGGWTAAAMLGLAVSAVAMPLAWRAARPAAGG